MSCATIRVTDPPRSATEQFLISVAAANAIDQLAISALRDRQVYVESNYLVSGTPSADQSFLIGEIRAKLLAGGVRLSRDRDEAQIVLEVRSGGLGIDRTDYLLGIPSVLLYGSPATPGSSESSVPLATPELAIVKNTKQHGFAAVSFVAYWRDSGELISSSGPFVGRTRREDFWFFGAGPRTIGDIPPAQRDR